MITVCDSEKEWETVIDFTEGGKKAGVPLKEVLCVLKKMKEKDQRKALLKKR